MSGPIDRVVAVVPAADEEHSIGACLRALTASAARLAATRGVTAEIVVVLDDCHDRTADVVAGFPDVVTLGVAHRCVGAARRHGSAHALAAGDLRRTWLAHTDADSVVPVGWLGAMVALADRGADLVLGTVRPGPGLAADLESRWYAAHDLDDGHPHVHGANLGVRASSYAAVGGFAPLATGEDEDLASRLQVHGATVARTRQTPVITSSRPFGRAPDGFAGFLHARDGIAAP